MNSLNSFMSLFEDMFKIFENKIYKKAPFDKTVKGKVTEIINPYKYKVQLKGKIHTVSSVVECNLDDYVWVKIPSNNIQNMFIEYKTRS